MENEPEVILQQMTETRTALSDKVELLEQQVVDTIHGATAAVADTVENVKEAVQDTVHTAKESVEESVENIKRSFDVRYQVDKRPWIMMAGATTLGYLGGYFLLRKATGNGGSASVEWRAAQPSRALYGARIDGGSAHAREPGLVAQIGRTFESELTQLRELALGALFSLARELVVEALPRPMEHQVGKLIDTINVGLGGRPIPGPIFAERTHES